MALGISEQTEKTLLHHWQAFGAGDVEAIMADYAEDAVLIQGRDSIRVRSARGDMWEHLGNRRLGGQRAVWRHAA